MPRTPTLPSQASPARVHPLRGVIGGLFALWLLVFGCATPQPPTPPTQPSQPADTAAHITFKQKCVGNPSRIAELERTAKTVRAAYPNYFQAVFINEVSPTCGLVLITEPPPTVGQTSLELALGLSQTAQFTHEMGVDGWVKDLGFIVEHEGPEDLANRLSRAATALYGTSYGFVPIVVSKIAQLPSTTDISFDIGPATVNELLERERYQVGSELVSLSTLMDRQQTGFTRGDETAIFVFRNHTDMCKHQVDLRRFAVETDLVLGVAHTDKTTTIVGRRRRVPQSVLPPLRVETLLALAASDTKVVGQSYERTALPAGLFNGSNQSWAPIYLSPNVIDTEFGGVLNIADQLLKSWSMQGQVQYHPFTYPKPAGWPFQKPVMDYFAQSAELTFNWNTDGASFLLYDGGQYAVLGVARTGALPVLYDPGTDSAAVKPYQETAYDFFAATNDPTLARVVQYTISNQAFYLGHARATCTTLPSIAPLGDSLVQPTRAALIGLRDGTIGVAALAKSVLTHDGVITEPQLRSAGIPEDQHQLAVEQSTQPHLDQVRAVLRGASDDDLAQLAVVLSDRSQLTQPPSKRIQALQRKLTPQLMQFVVRHAVDISAARQAYQTVLPPQNPILHTPRVVYSSHATNVALSGGHNIGPSPTRYILADTNVQPGKVNTSKDNHFEIRVNPADIGKVDFILRALSGQSTRSSARTIESRLASVTPSARKITRSKTTPDIDRQQLVLGNNKPTSLAQVPGWVEEATPPSPSKKVLDALNHASAGGKQALHVDRQDDAYRVYMKGAGGKIAAYRTGSNHAILQGLETITGTKPQSLAVVFGPAYTARDVSALRQSLESTNQANVTVRSLSVEAYRGNTVANAKLGTISETSVHLGRYELEATVEFEGNGGSHMNLRMTIRSRQKITDPDKLIGRLLPRTDKKMEAFIDTVESAAADEKITLNVGMLYGSTTELDWTNGFDGRGRL